MSKTAVVTGAGRGIGKAIAEKFKSENYIVHALDVTADNDVMLCDVTNSDQVQSIADQIGPVDVLVNNAGVWTFNSLEDSSEDEFDTTISVNLKGPFNCIRAFGKYMLEQGAGNIVNVVSIAAKHANPGVGMYGPSKAALVSLTEQVAIEWGPNGIRCNGIGPGLVPTPGTGDFYEDEDVRNLRSSAVPLKRLATQEDIASAVFFLCHESSSYINGQIIYVDGGLSKALMSLLPRPSDL